MSDQTIVLQNGSSIFVNDEFQKVFIFDNEYEPFTFFNNTGSQATFVVGTLLGRDAASGNVVALDSTKNTNKEAIPIGVLAQEITDLANATTKANQQICIAGSIASGKLVLERVGDTLETVIDGQRLGDRIKGDTKGIALIDSDELTGFDNS